MNFSVLEKFILGKKNDVHICEDAIFTNDNFAAVIDGATSKSSIQIEGKSTGKLASELICEGLSLLPKSIQMKDAVNIISNQIYQFYQKSNLDVHMRENPQDRLTGCAAIYSHFRNEVWVIGDCQCIIGKTRYYNKKIIDTIIANTRSLFLEAELLKGTTVSSLLTKDIGREYILPLLKSQTKFQNSLGELSEYSYTVFDGFDIDINDIKVIKVFDDIVILATRTPAARLGADEGALPVQLTERVVGGRRIHGHRRCDARSGVCVQGCRMAQSSSSRPGKSPATCSAMLPLRSSCFHSSPLRSSSK